MARIAIDMTPVLPGGENGGAKLLALELLKGFRASPRNHEYVILTSGLNHDELSVLDGNNMRRLCVAGKPALGRAMLDRFPVRLRSGLRKIFRAGRKSFKVSIFRKRVLAGHDIDLLFCPFTAPTHAAPGVPVVSLVIDLQHMDYPQFFSRREIEVRNAFMNDMCRKADTIICISESTRKAVITHLRCDPDRTHTIHICIQSRLVKPDARQAKEHLVKLSLDQRPYMFFPANFWPHKNHLMLITAYGMYLSRNPEAALDLVFTGALDAAQRDVKENVRRMGLEQRIHFLGFLPEDQLVALWAGCSFLVFPSLYEGFGIPVLEAMNFGKPVICSNVTSLPEVAGDAALYFDPRKPHEIADCMERLTKNEDLRSELIHKGYKRLSLFQAKDMVDKYLEHFEDLLNNPQLGKDKIWGVYPDGWTDTKLQVTHGGGNPGRLLQMSLEAPGWAPYKQATICLDPASGKKQQWTIERGETREIRLPMETAGNHLFFSVDPGFVPSQCNMGADDRSLGVLCKKCLIIFPAGEPKVLWQEEKP
jgi:glycosyltransferase involved in cell wall biosynthesis